MPYGPYTDQVLAVCIRRFAMSGAIAADAYSAACGHKLTTNNDRQALQRVMYGSSISDEDRERLLRLADYIKE
jgi:tRNA isopentenyl-2-thiomethyl-A-37 hydroxylase MiaE